MDGTLCIRRLPALALLVLCAAAPLADAQQFVCSPIRRGDTASRLARRLTGNPAAAYSLAFQVRDPARQLFVPKSHYLHLSTRWQACVAVGEARTTPLEYTPAVALAASAVAPAPAAITSADLAITSAPLALSSTLPVPVVSHGSRADFTLVATAASGAVLMLLLYAVVDSRTRRPIPPVLQRAGDQFVDAFSRPLIDPSSSVPPVQVQMRFARRAQQLEISIAPGVGRRYPNLVDHKRNVEYDVARVMQVLGSDFVVSGRLRASGKWVVVPIRVADVNQAGAQ